MLTFNIDRNDLIELRNALATALAKPPAAAAVYSAPKVKFVRSVNLHDINDSKSSAYLREAWAVVRGLDTIPKSTGQFHNRTLLAAEINRIISNMSPDELAAVA